MAEDRQRIEAVRTFIDGGELEGKTVGLYTEAHDKTVTDEAIKPLLDDASIDVKTSVAADDFGDDQAAQDQALDVIVVVVPRRRRRHHPQRVGLRPAGGRVAAQRGGCLDALLSTSA